MAEFFRHFPNSYLEAYADKIIKKYSSKLRSGWRPWAQDTIIYKDEFAYNTEQVNFGNDRKDNFFIRKYAYLFYVEMKERQLAIKKYMVMFL